MISLTVTLYTFFIIIYFKDYINLIKKKFILIIYIFNYNIILINFFLIK